MHQFNTLMTGASSVRELGTHQLINSPKKAELLCLTVLSYSLLLPAVARRAEWEDHSRGLQGLRLQFRLVFVHLGEAFLDKKLFISLLQPSTEARFKQFFSPNVFFVNSTLKKNIPYLNRLEPSNGVSVSSPFHFLYSRIVFSWLQNVKSLV